MASIDSKFPKAMAGIVDILAGFGLSMKMYDNEGKLVVQSDNAERIFVDEPNMLITADRDNEEIRMAVEENSEEVNNIWESVKNFLDKKLMMRLDYRVFGKRLEPKSDKVNLEDPDGVKESVLNSEVEIEMQGVTESFGSMYGSTKTSYQPLDNVKLIVKHKKAVNEETRGSRSRNISKIMLQKGDERFALPTKNLGCARAVARHVYNGGSVHDEVSESIFSLQDDLVRLKEFVSYVKSRNLINEDNSEYVTLAEQHIGAIREIFKKLTGTKTYANAVESVLDFSRTEILEDDIDLESQFVETHFDDKVSNAMDTLKNLTAKRSAYQKAIEEAIEKETFAKFKNLMTETEGYEFSSNRDKLGFQVSQLGAAAENKQLGSFLSGLSSKITSGGQLNDFDYRTLKASLMAARSAPVQSQAPDSFLESVVYENFFKEFDVDDK